MKKLLLSLSLCLLCSCSAHLYNTSNHNISETSVVLDKANFEIIGVAEGSAQANYLFGIGGLSQKSLKGNAVADMYKNANLTGSQAIINVTFKQRVTGVIIWGQIEYTATGTIIEFFDGARPVVPSVTADVQNNNAEEEVISCEVANVETVEIEEKPQIEEFIFSKCDSDGTWYNAVEYCRSLGEEWTLPSSEQVEYIIDNYDIKFSSCWTNTEVNEKKAKAYSRGDASSITMSKSTNDIVIIAVKVVDKEVK